MTLGAVSDDYVKDAAHVYCFGLWIYAAYVTAFHVTGNGYAEDDHYVYYLGDGLRYKASRC